MTTKGLLRRCYPSVWVMGGFPPTWHQQAMSALLSMGGAALSHRAAARFWGLSKSPQIAITVPTGAQRRRFGFELHRSEQLEPFVVSRSGMRVTSVARTLVDLSSCYSYVELARTIDRACHADLVKSIEIELCLDRMETRGRSRITQLRKILAVRNTNDEKLDSFLERRVLAWLRSDVGPEPTAQHWVVANGTRYEIDLAYPDAKVAIEPDGPHHLLSSVAEYDRRRDADLQLEGWLVVHVYPESQKEQITAFVRAALSRRAA